MVEEGTYDEAVEQIERLTAERAELIEAMKVCGLASIAEAVQQRHAAIPREFDYGTYTPPQSDASERGFLNVTG